MNDEQQLKETVLVDLTDLTNKVDTLVQVLNEQAENAEIEKEAHEQALKEQEQQAIELEQQELEQQELEKEQLELEKSQNEEFKDSVLTALNNLDSLNNESELLEIKDLLKQLTDQQALVIEMYNEVLPSVKQSSNLEIIFLCLIPLFLVVRWLGSMFNSAFR